MSLPSEVVTGVDISQWQGKIDWAILSAKAKFVFIRSAYGTYADRLIQTNWPAAKAAGIPRGAYLYYYPTVDAGQQARAMIEALGGDYGELPLVVDVEEPKVPCPWTDKMVADLKWCLDVLEQFSGRKTILYTGTWYWDAYLGSVPWANSYSLWVAQYRKDWSPEAHPTVPKAWQGADPAKGYSFWQYSSTGTGADYGAESVFIDLDVFNGTLDLLPRKPAAA
jgi:lysozyme